MIFFKSLDGEVILDNLCISGPEIYFISYDYFKVYLSMIGIDKSEILSRKKWRKKSEYSFILLLHDFSWHICVCVFLIKTEMNFLYSFILFTIECVIPKISFYSSCRMISDSHISGKFTCKSLMTMYYLVSFSCQLLQTIRFKDV